jgi:hypothetical protein
MSKLCEGIPSANKTISDVLNTENVAVFLKLYVLLYADDTVILAENANQLQKALDAMLSYCVSYKLVVNVKKTKVVIFSRGKVKNIPSFQYNNGLIEVTIGFTYRN